MSRLLNSCLVRLIIVIAVLIAFALMIVYLRVPLPAIELAAEPIYPPLPNAPFDILGFKFSITNSLIASWLSMIVLIVFSFLATRNMKMIPSGLQNVAELIVETAYNFCASIAGERTAKFFPWVMTIFLWVLVSNWLGLTPLFVNTGYLHEIHEGSGYKAETLVHAGPIHLHSLTTEAVEADEAHGDDEAHGKDDHDTKEKGYALVPFLRAPSTDLTFTVTLATISVFVTQIFGLQALGLDYVNRFIPFKSLLALGKGDYVKGIDLIVGPLEIISEIAKIVSFSFRLFGNIFAGEVLLSILTFLIPYIVPLPFYGLEIFVGAMQAFVFGILTLMFMTMATTPHGEGH